MTPHELSSLDVVLFLALYFGLSVDGGGQRDVGTVEVVRVLALVRLVLALHLVVVADTEEYDADDYQHEHHHSTCHQTTHTHTHSQTADSALRRSGAYPHVLALCLVVVADTMEHHANYDKNQ